MKKMFLLFSHKLSESQILYAQEQMAIDEFIYLPKDLQSLWSNVPPDLNSLQNYLQPLEDYLKKSLHRGDIALVQGDFGAVYQTVNFCRLNNIESYYATTKRNVIEYIDKNNQNVKKSVFEFRRFREYV
jgi:hypothetical protein